MAALFQPTDQRCFEKYDNDNDGVDIINYNDDDKESWYYPQRRKNGLDNVQCQVLKMSNQDPENRNDPLNDVFPKVYVSQILEQNQSSCHNFHTALLMWAGCEMQFQQVRFIGHSGEIRRPLYSFSQHLQ